MTITQIKVRTERGIYAEKCYSLSETSERVFMIQECDNVIGVEVISMETGEILYHYFPDTEDMYVSETFTVDLAEEVLG